MRGAAAFLTGFVALGAVATASAAEIRGRVVDMDEAPKPKIRKVSKDSVQCGEQQRDETLVVGKDGALANVVISLADPPDDDGFEAPQPVLDQKDCLFIPHVVVGQVGQKLDEAKPFVPSTSTYESELVLAPLPPAEYLLEITATIGEDTVKKLVALKIVG